MTKDAMDEILEDFLRDEPAETEPTKAYAEALLAETTRALPRPRRRPWGLLVLLTTGAVAAIVLLFASLTTPSDPDGAAPVGVIPLSVADAGEVPSFSPKPMASQLYLDPVEYLRKHDVDVTVAGLVSLWRRMAGGEDPGVHSAKWAILDALSRRAGSAYAPLLTELWEVDPDPTARRHVLLMLTRARDRAVRPWLDARLRDAPARHLRDVAKARVALALPDAAAAVALRASAASHGLLGPTRPEYSAGTARDLLLALHALGHPDVLADFERVLKATPTPDLVHAAWIALGKRPAPKAFRTALDHVAERALAAEDTGYDDVKVLDLLARTGDARFVLLLEKVLADDYVALAVDAARMAGVWREKTALPVLLDAWRRAKRMGEDGLDLIPPVLWACGRCGDADAVPRLLSFLEAVEWYRAGEWAVDALLSLGAPIDDILLALPNETFSVGCLPGLLARATRNDLRAVEEKIPTLPDGHLKSALLLVRARGGGPEVRQYIRTVIDRGGTIGLHLRLYEVSEVRATLGKKSEHDAITALMAIPVLPVSREEQREIAAGALERGAPRVRAEAAAALVRLGGRGATASLRDRLARGKSPFVRERIALALVRLGSDEALPLILGTVPAESRLRVVLDRETLLRTDPDALRARLEDLEDPLAEGYRALLSGEERRGKRHAKRELFEFEPAR